MKKTPAPPFHGLRPEVILDAVESTGLSPNGQLLALNSFENRVWQVGLHEEPPVVIKLYRPNRWSDEAITEEHEFAAELADAGLSVVAPLIISGQSLHHHEGYRFAVFPRRGGHAPEPAHEPTLRILGRALGRLHAVGASGKFMHRPELTIERFGQQPTDWLLTNNWLPPHLQSAFASLAEHLLDGIAAAFERAGPYQRIRLHGDCHPGNILWRNDTVHFVDLDDCLTGPAMQDLWMLISGSRHEREQQLGWLIEEYRLFCDFNPRELHLMEALRTLRMLHHQTWLARRWHDPAFPQAFPWFGDDRHWENVMTQLREQLGELAEPGLQLQSW